MEFGGFFGMGNRRYAIPWQLLVHVAALDGYLVPLTKNHIEDAPRFEEEKALHFTDQDWTAIDDQYARHAVHR